MCLSMVWHEAYTFKMIQFFTHDSFCSTKPVGFMKILLTLWIWSNKTACFRSITGPHCKAHFFFFTTFHDAKTLRYNFKHVINSGTHCFFMSNFRSFFKISAASFPISYLLHFKSSFFCITNVASLVWMDLDKGMC